MRIQNNITAKSAHRTYEKRNEKAARSGEKLASGLQVNSAADDSAGLSISEKMRTQIRGLKQAEKGVADGISLIQTVDGSLEQISSILQRMNEIAVEAATGTLDESDRQVLDLEFQQLKDEIDDIADETTFNNMKLLDGSLSQDPIQAQAARTADASSQAAVAEQTTTTQTDSVTGAAIQVTTATFDPANMRVGDTVTLGDRSYRLIDPGSAEKEISANFVSVNWKEGSSKMSDMVKTVLAYPPTTVSVEQATDENGFPQPDRIVVKQKSGYPQADTQITILPGEASGSADGLSSGPLRIQGGALENEQVTISVDAMSVDGLGLSDSHVRTQESAGQAITSVREAVAQVSMQRASLGATSNRLEHKVSSLQITGENTVVSESRIRDLDMASEFAELTKNNVLAQGATAVMAQSNAIAENVLSLLR